MAPKQTYAIEMPLKLILTQKGNKYALHSNSDSAHCFSVYLSSLP